MPAVKEELGEDGGQVVPAGKGRSGDRHTAEGKASKNDFARLGYQLRENQPDAFETYRKLDWKAKGVWLQNFRVDPSLGWTSAMTSNEVSQSKKDSSSWRWLTQAQLSGPLYLNSARHAELVCGSNLLDSRPSSISALASEDIEEFHWCEKWKTLEDCQRESTAIKAEGDLSLEVYEAVLDNISSSSLVGASKVGVKAKSPAKGRALPPGKKARTKEDIARVDKLKKASSALAKASALVGKISSSIREQSILDITGKLSDPEKPYLKELIGHVQAEAQSVRSAAQDLHKKWSAWTMDLKEGKEVDPDLVLSDVNTLDAAFSKFEQGAMAHAKHFTKSLGQQEASPV